MGKEIEKTGIPVVVMCNLIDVAKTVGANRMVQTVSVPYPLGDPELSAEAEWQLRTSRVEAALNALATDIAEPTVFPSKF
ncbi:selenoprotein B, glycine/betaine/sarcosine/D-proline reductase domain protein [Pyramidobacter piscolens W5455]|mgnify:FL=1|uniref:Selenoprotein B, glycine/betaine/sarcosine/D-proline reductase domain protein n=2 Tax=Pyramidobacter TaxID=638847 RepID=A0ABP2HSB6_9BACT|nr:selenoprotein B, glycine/betaine/sarcosine/D-proline reductase domain protein [Pyramidobacter piscolens W5455]